MRRPGCGCPKPEALLDLPKWMTDGHCLCGWKLECTQLDNDLKVPCSVFQFKSLLRSCSSQPKLAGHAFWVLYWRKIPERKCNLPLIPEPDLQKRKPCHPEYLQEKLKDVLIEFMQYNRDKYFKDIRARRNVPNGGTIDGTKRNWKIRLLPASGKPQSKRVLPMQWLNIKED